MQQGLRRGRSAGLNIQPSMHSKPAQHDDDLDADFEEIPRPHKQINQVPDFQPRDSYSHTSHSSHASSPIRSSRPRSPLKTMADFRLSDVRIRTQGIGNLHSNIPIEVKKLFEEFEAIAMGQGVLPLSAKQTFWEKLPALRRNDLFVAMVEDDDVGHEEKPHQCGGLFFSRMVEEIVDNAEECRNRYLPEPAWNSRVHSRLLELALKGYCYSRGVWFDDITTARISDPQLLPKTTKGKLESKMADYALTLSSTTIDQRVEELLRDRGLLSVNQTTAQHVRFLPLSVAMETKAGAISEPDALVQLSLWATSHYKKLRQLCLSDATLPILPMVVMQGNEWKLLIASPTDPLEPNRDGIVIYEHQLLGSSSSIFGVYQIVKAVRRLARWSVDEYQPWFNQHILGIGQA